MFAKPAASTHTTCVEHGRAIIALHDELAEQTASAIISLQDELADLKISAKPATSAPAIISLQDELTGAKAELTGVKEELATVKAELQVVLRVADELTQLVASVVHGPGNSVSTASTNSGPASPASTGSTTFLLGKVSI